jgi:hypothetical protein
VSWRVAFSTVNQLSGLRLVSDVTLLIARALVLLIHGGLFDSRLCTFFLVLLGCYSLSLLFQIKGSNDCTLFCFDLQVEMNDIGAMVS